MPRNHWDPVNVMMISYVYNLFQLPTKCFCLFLCKYWRIKGTSIKSSVNNNIYLLFYIIIFTLIILFINPSFCLPVTQSEQERSCIALLRLQRRCGQFLWVHAVLQLKDNLENSQRPVIVCTNQVLRWELFYYMLIYMLRIIHNFNTTFHIKKIFF